MPDQLENSPLIEALLELKWKLNKIGPDTFEDPGHKWASGRLYDRIRERFGHIQELPSSMVPEELTPHTVRNQFRREKNGWPLVQLGPGIATVNFTSPYTWESFRENIEFFIPQLIASYSGVMSEEEDVVLNLESAKLRYINGQEWDWSENNTLEYFSSNLHTNFNLPERIVGSETIEGMPNNISLQVGYQVSEPRGTGITRFATGRVGQSKGVVWEILFLSTGNNAPDLNNTNSFMEWLNGAHDVVEEWFFALIEGELETSFRGG